MSLKHPLSIAKQLVDFDIDADRTDFVARDGLLAGGEYGHYDIRRLCDSVFIEQDEEGWGIVYSEKALTSMEALLLDRYRTHVWIHFHHRVVAMKMLMRFLIEKALERKLVRKEHFDPSKIEAFTLRDDVWLWNVLREMPTNGDRTLEMVKHAVFYREKRNTLNLWKTRPGYHALHRKVAGKARFAILEIENLDAYCRYLSRRMKVHVLGFEPSFKALSEKRIMLYSEEEKRITNNEIREVSRLIAGLKALWEDDPQLYILLVGKNARTRRKELRGQWVKETADWIRNPRLRYH